MAEPLIGIETPITTLWNADTCPVAFLPWLAWALSVEIWDSGWSEDAKRGVIRESIAVHRQKGTVASVKRALAAAGYGDAVVIERYGWELHDGKHIYDGSREYNEPDHWAEYRVKLVRPISLKQAAQVREILATVAPVHCHLKALEYDEALHLYDAEITNDATFAYGVA